MNYVKGFVPLYDEPRQTVDNGHCSKCGRSMWSYRNGNDYYIINEKPYCVNCARELCNRYGIELKLEKDYNVEFKYIGDEI